MDETIEQVIEGIKARNITLSVKDGDRIIASRPLLLDEEATLRANRAAAVAIITAIETPEQAYQRGHRDGYIAGIEHATQEFQSRPPVASPVAPAPRLTTPDEELEKFKKWISCKSDYYRWEDECLAALHAALIPGDRIQPLFAYSCVVIHADGREQEFKRVPTKRK
jgi:hypothetical protein